MGYKSLTNYNRPDKMEDRMDSRKMQLRFEEMREMWRKEQEAFREELDEIVLEF